MRENINIIYEYLSGVCLNCGDNRCRQNTAIVTSLELE